MRDDLQKAIDAAKQKNHLNPLGVKGQLKILETQLKEDEQILFINSANANLMTKSESLKANPFEFTNKKPGLFIITSKRVIHISKILFEESLEQIMLEDINNVEYKSSLMSAILRIQSISNTLEVDLNKDLAQKYISEINNLKDSISIGKSGNKIDIADQIKKLASLKNDGILTEEEFEKKKKELLERL
jgi:hypothetical protein